MSKRCLNHYVTTPGTWTEGQSDLVDTSASIDFGSPIDVVIHETAHSGHVLLTRSGESSQHHPGGVNITVHSGPTTIVVTDTQIYLNLIFGDGHTQFVSAPLTTSLEFPNVKTIELHFVFCVGPPGWKKSDYKCIVNAHVIFEQKAQK
jgi:hypothetical protein